MAGERRRGGGDERFYCPPAMRGMYNQQKQRYNQQQQQPLNGDISINYSKKGKSKGGSKESSNNRIEYDDGASLTTTAPSIAPSPLSDNFDNLDRFLEYSTPAVMAQKFPKTSMKGWKNSSDEFHPHFILGDLWECFGEWSAYGAGVPLLLNGRDSVVQYYVPSLSAIQLYIDPSKPFIGKKKHDESDGDSSRETSSDSSCEAVPDMGVAIQRFNSHSLRNNHLRPSADDSDVSNQPGVLVYQHLEQEPPPRRKPLSDMISEIASDNPQIKLLRSCDLTPASWLSVAWYPIYRIPIGATLHNVEACFLTYHSLSTPTRSTSCHLPHHQASTTCRGVLDDGMSEKLLVPAFGLSSYKLNIPVWGLDGQGQKLNSLLQAAENWLRLLQVNHPDYNFFMSRRVNFR